MKRSFAPIFWLLFGAGGMLSVLVGPALVLITGLSASTGFLSFARVDAFARHPLGKLFLLAVIALFVWHAAERICFTLRDMHLGSRRVLSRLCYGAAALVSVFATCAVLAVGF
jgi:fumarate reductase subunit D